MLRTSFMLVTGLLMVSSAAAQQPIQWISNLNQGVAAARKSGRPILFYVTGKTSAGTPAEMMSMTVLYPAMLSDKAACFI